MNDDERRLHDWFDGELDRMSISADRPVDPRRVFASETDRALSETAHDLRKLDAGQTAEPSPGFLQNLEMQLMSSNAPGHSWSGPTVDRAAETLTSPGRLFRPDGIGARGIRRSSFATLALVFALILTSAGAFFVTNQLREGGGGRPLNVHRDGKRIP